MLKNQSNRDGEVGNRSKKLALRVLDDNDTKSITGNGVLGVFHFMRKFEK